MTEKKFDCVEMKRRGSQLVYETTKGMTREDEIAFWKEQTAKLLRLQEKAILKAEARRQTAGPVK